MQPKDFLYFMVDQDGRSARVNNGVVEFVSTPSPLEFTADGWQDKAIHYTRNTRYAGVFRSFTTPLKFVKDGAEILRHVTITKGTEFKLYLVILWLDKSYGGGWVHRLLYRGEFDLTNIDSQEDYVTANILEGDLMKLIKANESTQYEIPLDVPEAIYVKSDGIPIDYNEKWGTIEETLERRSLGSLDRSFYSCTLFTLPSEGYSGSLAALSASSGIITDFPNSTDYFIETVKATTIKFNIHLKFDVDQSNQARDGFVRIQIRDQAGAILSEFFSEDLPDDAYTNTYTVDTVVTLSVAANKRLFIGYDLQVRRQTVGSGEAYLKVLTKETEFNIEYTATKEITFTKHLRPAYVAQQLLNKMTESTDFTFESDYLSNTWENLVMTSGNAIRGIAGSVIKTSWGEFFDSYNVPCNIGMKIFSKTLKIEPWGDAYQLAVAANLGEVKDLSWKIPSDLLYSGVKIGYPDISYGNVNGKYEFNTLQSYVGPIKKVNRLLELTSKYRADAYGYEFIRIEGAGKDTTDLKSDNDVFLTHVEKTATAGTGTEPALYYKFLRNAYTITGLIKPDYVWNVEISPKRCLLAHGNRIRSCYYWQSGEKLVFQTAPKDTAMKTVDGSGNIIEERAEVFIGNLAAPAYIPIEMKSEGKINRAILNAIEAEAHGSVAFSYDGETFFGFVNDIGIQPATLASQDTTMLCSPMTDITKLIH